MSWNEYRRRGETLRAVIEHADTARDGALPMELPRVWDDFADEQDLVGALALRWHSRLSGNLERALATQPVSLEEAVAGAWAETARQLPGVRAILDRAVEQPVRPEMSDALERARRREWADLALASGRASTRDDPRAVAAGRQIEELARGTVTGAATEEQPMEDHRAEQDSRAHFVRRLRAALVA